MAGVLKSHIQLGDSGTATNNFMLTAQAADGTMKLARGNNGATTQDVITVDTNGKVAFAQGSAGSVLTSGTAIATTSGTSHDFTSIPSWVKRITVTFMGVSTSGTNNVQIQIGDSGGIETTGYLGTVWSLAATGGTLLTASFGVTQTTTAAAVLHGLMTIVLSDTATNTWSASSIVGHSNSAALQLSGGSKSLTGTLDRLRLTTVGGTDTFDAGSINILYE
jgi:hypothetical protein